MQFRNYKSFDFSKNAPLMIVFNNNQDEIDLCIVEESLRMAQYDKETLWIRNGVLKNFPNCKISNYNANELFLIKIKHGIEKSFEKEIIDFCSEIQKNKNYCFYQILVDLNEWSLKASEVEISVILSILSDTALYILSHRNEELKLLSTQMGHIEHSFPITIFISQNITKNKIITLTQFSNDIKTLGEDRNIVDLNFKI